MYTDPIGTRSCIKRLQYLRVMQSPDVIICDWAQNTQQTNVLCIDLGTSGCIRRDFIDILASKSRFTLLQTFYWTALSWRIIQVHETRHQAAGYTRQAADDVMYAWRELKLRSGNRCSRNCSASLHRTFRVRLLRAQRLSGLRLHHRFCIPDLFINTSGANGNCFFPLSIRSKSITSLTYTWM